MWTCSSCLRTFSQQHQSHYCGTETVSDFLVGKTDIALALFDCLIARLGEIAPIKLHATKSMIVISAPIRFAYIIQIGKNFIDVVLPFKTMYQDNLCFRKIGQVPGTSDYNHHLRLMHAEDLNEEVIGYLKLAYENGKGL